MNGRERFLATVERNAIDRPVCAVHMGPWPQTLAKWRGEGLETDDWVGALGLDITWNTVPLELGMYPVFEEEFLDEDEETITFRDERGRVQRARKDGLSMPQWLEYPVKSEEDWERIKAERFVPGTPGRFPDNWAGLVKEYSNRDFTLAIGKFPQGVFGTPRDLLGAEEFLMAFHMRPELVRRIMNDLTDHWLAVYEIAMRDVEFDVIHIWEDMAYKHGSLISPAMFREFMTPCYKRIAEFARRHNVKVLSVDTDGNCDELVPLFLEAGVNLVLPFEVQAGNDVLEYGRKYPELTMLGGFDKRALAQGRGAIDRELRRLEPLVRSGTYILSPDHLIPPDVSWASFEYFAARLREICGKE